MAAWSSFFWKAPGNALGFAMRRLIRWERGLAPLSSDGWENGKPGADGLSGLFASRQGKEGAALLQRAAVLEKRYGLAPFRGSASKRVYLENLYLLDALDGFLAEEPLPPSAAPSWQTLDVGTGPWEYAPSLLAFLSRWKGKRPVTLTGLEVDGHLLYPDFRSRADYARAYAAAAEKIGAENNGTEKSSPAGCRASIRFEDFLQVELPAQDIITLFYPFILPHQILAWGLPYRFLKPQVFLAKAVGLLKPGGRLLAFLHAEEERSPFERYIREAGGTILRSAAVASRMTPDWEDLSERRAYWIAGA